MLVKTLLWLGPNYGPWALELCFIIIILYFVISLLLVQKNLIGLQCSIPVVVNSIGIDQKATIMKTVITPYLSVLILPVKQKVTGNNKIKISEKRKKKKT